MGDVVSVALLVGRQLQQQLLIGRRRHVLYRRCKVRVYTHTRTHTHTQRASPVWVC